MFCAKCSKDLVDCDCPDIDQRLQDLLKVPGLSIAIQQNIDRRKAKQQREN